VIFFIAPGGRTGNLLFQLAYIESIRRPGELVLCAKLRGTQKLFLPPGRRYLNTDFKPIVKLLDKFLVPWFGRFLKRTKLGTVVWERQGHWRVTRGHLPITWIDGYFQSPPNAAPELRIPLEAMATAESIVQGCPGGFVPVFVHVRRTDYEAYIVDNLVRPLLPECYYRDALDAWKNRNPNSRPWVLFVGDSPDWCEVRFADVQPQRVLRNSPLVDLALMSQCSGGVVSNSTFAWWGFWFLRKNHPGDVIGPRFWLGWPIQRWMPTSLEDCGLHFIEVVPEPLATSGDSP
jgi:hypothetical protein